MVGTHRILAVVAHPGDEAWALGPLLARYVDEGARVHLVCATRGEGGRFGSSRGLFPARVLGRMRERELDASATVLGLHGVEILGYPDGGVASLDPFRMQMDLAVRIRRVRPQVVVTFGAQGPDGDPDRAVVGEATHAAILAAARHSAPVPGGDAPHAVRKAYQRVWSRGGAGPPRRDGAPVEGAPGLALPPPTPEWMVTTVVDTRAQAARGWGAMACHRSRPFCPRPGTFLEPSAAWDRAELIRSVNTVAVPPGREGDLMAGIRGREGRGVRAA